MMLYLRCEVTRKFGKAPIGRPFFDDLKSDANNCGRFDESMTDHIALNCCDERDANREFRRIENAAREQFPNACVSIRAITPNEYDYYQSQEEEFDDFMHRILGGKVVKS